MSSPKWVSAHIQKMEGYVPGEQPALAQVVKLNTNENPYDPPMAVFEALQSIQGLSLRRYPSAMGDLLRQKIARVYQINPEGVLLGNGSDELLTMIMRSCVYPKEIVACGYPTYILYETLVQIQGAQLELTPFDAQGDLSEEALAKLNAKVFFLANPNSPTGTWIKAKRVAELAKSFNGLFVVDEAYVDFAEESCLELVEKRDNILVLRTLSKSFSLAGIRLGWAYGRPELIQQLIKVKDSYNINALTQAVALAAFDNKHLIDQNIVKIKQTRAWFEQELSQKGWQLMPSSANFVWAKPPQNAKQIYQNLKEKGILIRYFSEFPEHLRISIGLPEEMQRLLDLLE